MASASSLLVFGVVLIVFYLLLILPQQRRARQHRTMVASLKPGDTVMTIGGVIGVITGLAEDTALVEVAPDVIITVARQAVARTIEEPVESPIIEEPSETGGSDA